MPPPPLQGYLAHDPPPPRRTLQKPHVYGPMVILGGGSFLRARYPCTTPGPLRVSLRSFWEIRGRSWSQFVCICRQRLAKSSNTDF